MENAAQADSAPVAPRPGAIRRSVFEAVGGFDTRFPGADLEDMDLGYRIIKARHPIFLAPVN